MFWRLDREIYRLNESSDTCWLSVC